MDFILTYLSYDYFLELFFSATTGSTNNLRFGEPTYTDYQASFVGGDCEVSDDDDCEASDPNSDLDTNSYVRLPSPSYERTMNVFEEMSIQFEVSTAR